MNKESIRKFILNHTITRELFFIIGQRKVNLKKIDKAIEKNKISLSKTVEKDLVVSLTSYGQRLEELHYTLFSLVNQTIAPEKIIVNLSANDFEKISPILHIFQKYGVEFTEVEDTKSYKKLIPTLQKYPDKIIITADDDLYYKSDWLEKLLLTHKKFPTMILCHLTAKISFLNNKLKPYNEWQFNKRGTIPSYSNLILSGAGTLFPPNSLYKDVCNADLFMKLSPTADDIWDYFMAFLQGTKIIQIQNSYSNLHYVNPYREYGIINGKTLTQENVMLGKNDEQFKNVLSYYNISEEDFIKSIEKEYEETND